MDCDPRSLVESSKCLRFIPRGTLREVMIYLLCRLASDTVGNNPPTADDFQFSISGSKETITVTKHAPSGIPGFLGQYHKVGAGFWSVTYSNAPGQTSEVASLTSGANYEAQIAWALDLNNQVSAWSPSRFFVAP